MQGKAPFKLWLGRVKPGAGGGNDVQLPAYGVVALEDIPAGSFILPRVGEYRVPGEEGYKEANMAASALQSCFLLQKAAVPVHAATTAAQQAMCAAAPHARKFDADKNEYWRDLTNVVLDCRHRGNAARFIRRSSRPNVGSMELDLPTGPTGVFLYAMRDISKGEELIFLGLP